MSLLQTGRRQYGGKGKMRFQLIIIITPSAPLRAVILLSQIVVGALAGWLAVAMLMGL